jgi:hypothetical protein
MPRKPFYDHHQVGVPRMRQLITVSPAGDAWQVRPPAAEPQLFRSGGQAELSARRLAERLARHGQAAEVEIHLRDGRLAARLHYEPAAHRHLDAA